MCRRSDTESREKNQIFTAVFCWVGIIAVLVCLIGMGVCCYSFIKTSMSFSNECEKVLLEIASDAAAIDPPDPSASLSPAAASGKNDMIDSLITHMESMVSIQRSGMTNDLMSFVYGILSAVLVGLCATFVVKSRSSADEAKKTADEAKENAEAAKRQAEIAEEKAKETQKAIEQAKNAASTAKKIQYQVKLIIISSRIASAKSALLGLNNIIANRVIIQIRDEICAVFLDDEFILALKSNDFDRAEIEKIYDELLDLQQSVDVFLASCKKEYPERAALESKKSAAKNYHKWIQMALECIDNVSSKIRKPEK